MTHTPTSTSASIAAVGQNRVLYSQRTDRSGHTRHTWAFRDATLTRLDDPDNSEQTFEWCDENDKLHRVGGPACVAVSPDGFPFLVWMLRGKRHRVDGPAEQHAFTGQTRADRWCLNDKIARLDGPADVNASGHVSWHSVTGDIIAGATSYAARRKVAQS